MHIWQWMLAKVLNLYRVSDLFKYCLQLSHKKIRVSPWCRQSPVLNNNSNSPYIYIIGNKINGSLFSASRMQFRIRATKTPWKYSTSRRLKQKKIEFEILKNAVGFWIWAMVSHIDHWSILHTTAQFTNLPPKSLKKRTHTMTQRSTWFIVFFFFF